MPFYNLLIMIFLVCVWCRISNISIFPICLWHFLRFAVKPLIGCVYNEHFYVPHAQPKIASVSCLNFATTDGKHTSWVTVVHTTKTPPNCHRISRAIFELCVLFCFVLSTIVVCSILLTYLFIPLNSLFF